LGGKGDGSGGTNNSPITPITLLIITLIPVSITMKDLTSLSIIRPRRRSTFKERYDQEEKKDAIPLFRNE